MSEAKKPPPRDELSAFKKLLGKLAKVPKAEMDEKEREFRKRQTETRKRRA